jgi:hypothetical protein
MGTSCITLDEGSTTMLKEAVFFLAGFIMTVSFFLAFL